MSGKIYIASMNMYGESASPISSDALKLNVTSAQGKNNKNRRDFSPMTEIPNGYNGYWNFESYWQSGKVFKDIPMEKTKQWWRELKEPKRRYPNSKNKQILYAQFDDINLKMDYITSRKLVYVPKYHELIKDREMTRSWKNMFESGFDIVIYDFDGPRTEAGGVCCLELTKELLIKNINDPKFPFGHGYIVGATIMGINPEEYV